jgi:N-acetylneuraminate synthase
MTFPLGTRRIGPGTPCFIVAEVGLAHEGSVGIAHAFIDAVAGAGADAVKFQTHIAEAESTLQEPFRVPLGTQDATRYDYWRRTAFTEPQWRQLAQHARQKGLCFLSSPFSVQAVELLLRVGVPAWKVASGQVSDSVMLERLLQTRLPILLSSGMSPLQEIDTVVAAFRQGGVPFAVLQATSLYPTPPEKVGLNLLALWRERYGCPVGLSDHSGTIWPGVAAATMGADLLEVHVTLSREMFGPDGPASLTIDELRQLVTGVRFIETMRNSPVDKDRLAEETRPLRALFTKSVVANANLAAGVTLTREDLAAKKPGTGIPAAKLTQLVGRRLRRAVRVDELLREDDLE